VLICPACQPAAVADLTRCAGCGGIRLIRRLDQIECLDCGLIREPRGTSVGLPDDAEPGSADSVLATEVAQALERLRRPR
jgi:hypothetical protein